MALAASPDTTSSITTTVTARLLTSQSNPASLSLALAIPSRRSLTIRQRRLAGYLCSCRFATQHAARIITTGLSPTWRAGRPPQREWPRAGRNGCRCRRLRLRRLVRYFQTNFADDTCNLYHNNGDGTLTDVTRLESQSPRRLGLRFVDYDNDGYLHHQINGHVYPEIDQHDIGQTFKNPRLVQEPGRWTIQRRFGGDGPWDHGTFLQSGAAFGIAITTATLTCWFHPDPPSLLRNDGGNSRTGSIKLIGTHCNRTAIEPVRVVTASLPKWMKSTAAPASCRNATCASTSAWARPRLQISSRSNGQPRKKLNASPR